MDEAETTTAAAEPPAVSTNATAETEAAHTAPESTSLSITDATASVTDTAEQSQVVSESSETTSGAAGTTPADASPASSAGPASSSVSTAADEPPPAAPGAVGQTESSLYPPPLFADEYPSSIDSEFTPDYGVPNLTRWRFPIGEFSLWHWNAPLLSASEAQIADDLDAAARAHQDGRRYLHRRRGWRASALDAGPQGCGGAPPASPKLLPGCLSRGD